LTSRCQNLEKVGKPVVENQEESGITTCGWDTGGDAKKPRKMHVFVVSGVAFKVVI